MVLSKGKMVYSSFFNHGVNKYKEKFNDSMRSTWTNPEFHFCPKWKDGRIMQEPKAKIINKEKHPNWTQHSTL
jgi:hypothetical protein